jgi:hypothetical protein
MDFSKLRSIQTTNPREQKFELKWSKVKESFTWSNGKFDELALEHNSLELFVMDEVNEIYLGVHPGNAGPFYKRADGKMKGKTFKSISFSRACEASGFGDNLLTVTAVGEHPELNIPLFKIACAVNASVSEEEGSVVDSPEAMEEIEADVEMESKAVEAGVPSPAQPEAVVEEAKF